MPLKPPFGEQESVEEWDAQRAAQFLQLKQWSNWMIAAGSMHRMSSGATAYHVAGLIPLNLGQLGQLAKGISASRTIVSQVSSAVLGKLASKKEGLLKRRFWRDYWARSREGFGEAFSARFAAARRGINPEEVVPLGSPHWDFNPRTGATDTQLGLVLDYGEGTEADAVRQRYADAIGQDLSTRQFSGAGLVPGPFVRLSK